MNVTVFVPCPIPYIPLAADSPAEEWIDAIRSYDLPLYAAYQAASFAQQGLSDAARYTPFAGLADFHSYWWTLVACRATAFFLLAAYLALQRLGVGKDRALSPAGPLLAVEGVALLVLVPAWNAQAATSVFQYQNIEFLLDWAFGWMVLAWGCALTVQKYFVEIHKLRFVGIGLQFWLWARQAFWANWNNTAPVAEYATASVASYVSALLVVLLLCDAEPWYSAIAAAIAGALLFTQQHALDHFPYVQVTDDMNPWRMQLWMALATLLVLFAVAVFYLGDALAEACRDWLDRRRHTRAALAPGGRAWARGGAAAFRGATVPAYPYGPLPTEAVQVEH